MEAGHTRIATKSCSFREVKRWAGCRAGIPLGSGSYRDERAVKVHSPQVRLLRSIFLRTVFQVAVVRKDSGQRVTIRLNIS